LLRYKYNVLSNPFGILYNTSSIAKSFSRIANKQYYSPEELVFHDGLYHSMDHHGAFSGTDQELVLNKINQAIDHAVAHLQNSRFAFVSLGTSRIYRYKKTGEIVGNNHKIPSLQFDAGILSVEECENDLRSIYHSLKHLSPNSQIIWTVSPIRHLKDGMIENQRSKAVLILAIEKFIRSYTETTYFPAYEIMMDQLRDYRFYARDMIHPSPLAIDIIWDVFCQTCLEQHEAEHHSSMEKINKAMEHRFLHDNKEAVKSFADAQLRNIDQLAALYPDMDWKKERQYFFQLIEPD
ncbi:MAG TPA: GSCFA domain-containing protein, partial [Saprospiraceae bacterium]|nr:GSCFA domain-containing protein [Saprospiraceae bacterium]